MHKINVPEGSKNLTAQMIEMGVSDLNIKLSMQKLNFISKSSAVKLITILDQYRENVKFKGYTYEVYTITPIQENSK